MTLAKDTIYVSSIHNPQTFSIEHTSQSKPKDESNFWRYVPLPNKRHSWLLLLFSSQLVIGHGSLKSAPLRPGTQQHFSLMDRTSSCNKRISQTLDILEQWMVSTAMLPRPNISILKIIDMNPFDP